MTEAKPTLIIYGASSFTARQLILYLDTHKDISRFDFILAGRNRERLESANGRLGTKREIAVCDLKDEQAVAELVEKGQVIINLAGPFRWHNAETLIRECAKKGKHYVDLTGESAWLATDIVPRYHELASQTGACIIPSCGFDSVPSDITLYLALKTLQERFGKQATIAESESFFKIKNASMSGGTIQSMYSLAELPKDQRRSGEYDLVPRSAAVPSRKSTSPQLTHQLDIPSEPTRFGSFFFMYPFNRCIIRRSAYLSTTSSASCEEPVHGQGMQYREALETGKSKFRSGLFSATIFFAFGLFFSSKLVRKIASYFLPKAGTGATDEQLFRASYKITNLSTSVPLADGQVKQVVTTFDAAGDPGYLSTCYLIAECALSLVLPAEGAELPQLAKQGGVLTPSTALGQVLVQRLNASGKVTTTSRIVEHTEGKKRV
ncbi:hypothetical protein IAU60_006679 [Kwoniella sp. DSM 27419]